jgi:hypothetical protein
MAQELTPELTNLMVSYGFEPWMQGYEEVGPATLTMHIAKSALIHKVGGKVFTNCIKATADALANPNDPAYSSFPPGTYEPLDWANYISCDDQYSADLMAGKVTKTSNRLEDTYWQNREDPQANRYYLGYFVWLTGLDGNTPTYYKAYKYNEFDWTDPTKRFRQYGSAYASVQGPVPTMQGEASREGIKDGKYLATWKYFKDAVATSYPDLAQQSETVINNLLERYKDKSPTVCPAAYRTSMAQYATDRQAVIHEITKLLQYAKNDATPPPVFTNQVSNTPVPVETAMGRRPSKIRPR